jgi:hypothetical protein
MLMLMVRMRRAHAGLGFFLAAMVMAAMVIAAPTGGQAQQLSERAKEFEALLRKTGFEFRRINPKVWVTDFKGKQGPKVAVISSIDDDMSVNFAIIAKKPDLPTSAEFLTKVVRMNDQFDYVKVGIDKDGDLFVRTDLMLRNLDGQELKQQLQQVANAADEAYGQIKPMLRGR